MRIHRLFTSKTKTLKHLRLCFLIFMFPNFSASGVDLGFSSTATLGEYFTYLDTMNLIVKEATGLPDKAAFASEGAGSRGWCSSIDGCLGAHPWTVLKWKF